MIRFWAEERAVWVVLGEGDLYVGVMTERDEPMKHVFLQIGETLRHETAISEKGSVILEFKDFDSLSKFREYLDALEEEMKLLTGVA